jgi:hypothetical protein
MDKLPRLKTMITKRRYFLYCALALVLGAHVFAAEETPSPVAPELQHIRALSRCGRIDLVWEQSPVTLPDLPNKEASPGYLLFFEIERRNPGEDHFRRINKLLWTTNVYGDYLGEKRGLYAYRVRGIFVSEDGKKITTSAWSPVVEASPVKVTQDGLITDMQEASFRYFYNWRHPISGLAREKTPNRAIKTVTRITPGYVRLVRDLRNLCTTGATGMGMFNLIVGVERGFITREEGAAWALQMLRFLSTNVTRFHGAFPHWLYGDTGHVRPFSGKEDNGADTVETAFLASGFIVLREYFTGNSAAEREIRTLADALWKGIEWDWFTRGQSDGVLYWHWSPEYDWNKNLPVLGFNEAAILYVLAIVSPTHAIHADSYRKEWRPKQYGTVRTEFGVPMILGHGFGPPLFFTHYSYLGLDPRKISYNGEPYFAHFQKFCDVQVKYAASKADRFTGYGPLWGLTSCPSPKGYKAHAPGMNDDGTIAPTAALSSMPYMTKESISFLEVLYKQYGEKLWKDYGFTDAFNLTEDWEAPVLLGIDAGPIAPMIENARSQLCWNTFMKAPEIQKALTQLNDEESINR